MIRARQREFLPQARALGTHRHRAAGKALLQLGVGVGGLVNQAGPYAASVHPYTNSQPGYVTLSWTNVYPGADGLRVSFDGQTQLGKNDYLEVLDGSGSAITGSLFIYSQLAGQTVLVPGDTVR